MKLFEIKQPKQQKERSILSVLGQQPEHVDDEFACGHDKLTSLQYAPQSVGGNFYCSDNKLTSLSGIHKQIKFIGDTFLCDGIVTHVLGLLFIKGLKQVTFTDNPTVTAIINKYLSTKDIDLCQDELIEVGLSQMAKL